MFRWMKQEHGFRDERVKPYTFNPAPFIADKKSAQQGYATSEPFEVERQGKFKPNIFLVADQGLDTYSTLIETRTDLIEKNPELVRRFVEAEVVPHVAELEHGDLPPYDILRKLVTKYVGVAHLGRPTNDNPASVLYGHIMGPEDLDRMGEEL